jgi:hypothetical protein
LARQAATGGDLEPDIGGTRWHLARAHLRGAWTGGGGIPPATAKRQVDRLISAFGDIAAELAA